MRITSKPSVSDITFSEGDVVFHLEDGRKVSAPLEWFPRLERASPEQRQNWDPDIDRTGIHWPDIDEDISVTLLLTGKCD